MQNVRVIVYKINIVRPICNNLVGKHHTFTHRTMFGIAIMIVGVLIAKEFGHSSNELVATIGDAVGYGLHGVGLTPFVEAVIGASEA